MKTYATIVDNYYPMHSAELPRAASMIPDVFHRPPCCHSAGAVVMVLGGDDSW